MTVGEKLFDGNWLAHTPCLLQSKGREHRAYDFAQRNWRLRAGVDRRHESFPLAAMTFVASQKRAKYSLLAAADKFQSSKVFKHRHTAAAENFQSFLGIGSVAVCQIADGTLRAISEAQRTHNIVIAVSTGVQQTASVHFNRRRTRQEAQEIDKVTNLSQDATSALLRIIQPVICGKETSIHAVVKGQSFVCPLHKLFHLNRQRGKAAIEPDHEKGTSRN